MIARAKITAVGFGLLLLIPSARAEEAPAATPLLAISGADGAFERVASDGESAVRTIKGEKGSHWPFVYFRVPDAAAKTAGPVYVEVRYRDLTPGRLGLEYNGRGARNVYHPAERGYGRRMSGQGRIRTAVFELAEPEFRHAQNVGADIRLSGAERGGPLEIVEASLYVRPTPLFVQNANPAWLKPYQGVSRNDIDASTLRGKVLCGYQGWFRCPGDPTDQGWVHWSRNSSRLGPDTATFDLWPDLSEFAADEKYDTPEFPLPGGAPASLFSSADPRTVDRHFEWMKTYGIDGVFVQRFVVGLGDRAEASRVLAYARDAANRTGRTFAVEYDMSGEPSRRLASRIIEDWKWLVDTMKVTSDPRYLRHDGKPVVAIFGFYPDRFEPSVAHAIIDIFKNDPTYRAALVGGCDWRWRSEKNPEWARAYRRFDAIKPWNVGNFSNRGGVKQASMNQWAEDAAEAKRAGMLYMPVIYPGFTWDNLMRKPSGTTTTSRRGGQFYWEQFTAAARLGVGQAFVAMFDEVDEGTAIFKVTNSPPPRGQFKTLDGLPVDWYLRLTGEGSRLLRGERKNQDAIPIQP